MTRIAQIEDRGAVVAWSPVKEYADLIALGSKDSGGIGFDDVGGELELYDLSTAGRSSGENPKMVGKIHTQTRFACIGWAPASMSSSDDQYPMGLLAGGMVCGTLFVWDVSKILSGEPAESCVVCSVPGHTKGPVSALEFNPHSECCFDLVTGGSNGEVQFVSLSQNPEQPQIFALAGDVQSPGVEITQIAWNTQVSHIVAASSSIGSVIVYDTKTQKPWCDLRCETNGMPISDIAWNPTEGLHIITASGDDRNPVMKLWDLRSSTSIPLATLQGGHTQGILSIGWCPHDSGLLLSCGKDNRTLLWDLFTLQAIYELPATETPTTDPTGAAGAEASSAPGMYGGSLSSSQQKRYDVKWSPIQRGVVSTCSFDRKVQTHSVIGAATKSGRTPMWMKRPCGVSCGFGGSIVSFRPAHRGVQIDEYVEEPELKQASEYFESSIAGNDFVGYCSSKANYASHSGESYESKTWGFMNIMFDPNAREQILNFLGFSPESIKETAMNYQEEKSNDLDPDFTPPMSKEAEKVVKQALLVGDIEAAVECCFQNGNLADALLLSSSGGPELWQKTQQRYFEKESKKRPFLSIVSAVVHSQLEKLVEESDPSDWQETLALLSTYGKTEEFPALCLALGERLDAAGDEQNASLCYMCALDLARASKYWKVQLDRANEESPTSVDLLALQAFVEKVSIFLNAVDPSTQLDSSISEIFSEYASILSSQGMLTTAAKYSLSNSETGNILRDRLYRGRETYVVQQMMGSSPPTFPFEQVRVLPGGITMSFQERKYQEEAAAAQAAAASMAQQNNSANHYAQANNASSYQTQQEPATNQAPQPAADELPPGWIALQDPASGLTYYANQSTGETTWDKPQPVSIPATQLPQQPVVSNPADSYQQQNHQNHYNTNNNTNHHQQQQVQFSQGTTDPVKNVSKNTSPNQLASKYGDGFVTSSSHPGLAEQYGNVGTSNPYAVDDRPGTASVSPSTGNNNIDDNAPVTLSPEDQNLVDNLNYYVSYLEACCSTMNEKKQLKEIEKGVTVFSRCLGRNEIDAGVKEKMYNFVAYIQNKDYQSAGAIQTALVNSQWRVHKEWLKGMKFFYQLAARKIQ